MFLSHNSQSILWNYSNSSNLWENALNQNSIYIFTGFIFIMNSIQCTNSKFKLERTFTQTNLNLVINEDSFHEKRKVIFITNFEDKRWKDKENINKKQERKQ